MTGLAKAPAMLCATGISHTCTRSRPRVVSSRRHFTEIGLTTVVLRPAPNGGRRRANLRGANPSGAEGPFANLSNANLNGAILSGARLSGANLMRANLASANLTDARLDSATTTLANFNRVTWSNTQCPDTTNSNDNNGTCIGHL